MQKPSDTTFYTDSLRAMHRASRDGKALDLPEVQQKTTILQSQNESRLEYQLDFFQEYQRCKQLESSERAKSRVRLLENQNLDMQPCFYELLPEWNAGRISTVKAGSLCGISPYLFASRAFEHNRRRCHEDTLLCKSICMDWFCGRISSELAARRFGLSKNQLLSFAATEGFQMACLPDVILEAFAGWMGGSMKKVEAAQHCSMTVKQFNACLKICGKPTVVFLGTATGNSYYESALLLYQQGVLTQAACAELCETSPVRFFRKLASEEQTVERKLFMPAPRAFPKGFCPAYRAYREDALTAQEAAEACSLPIEEFEEWVRKLAHGEDFQKVRARVDAEVLRWQQGEISRKSLLRALKMQPAQFLRFCEQEHIQAPIRPWKRGQRKATPQA
ncbi:MAG: hypothetical protein J5846_05770 [Desulfovibrio sp.]|nr:hypothetical protein [Desulfovibrio sp.]